MPYDLKKYNRDSLVTVLDGATESSKTSLTFVGKNFAGYGGIQNENFLYLLENFASGDPPQNPIDGQIWYDSANRKLRFYDKNYAGGDTSSIPPVTYAKWRPNGVEIGSVAPSGMTKGDLWFNTVGKQLHSFDGSAWVLIGPQSVANAEQTNLESISVPEYNTGNSYPVVKAVTGGKTVFIISKNQFEVAHTNSLYTNGFKFIHQGMTLVDTDTTLTDGTTTSGYRFWGTTTNSEKLNNVAASEYVLRSSANFTALAAFNSNDGLTVGANGALKIFVDTVPTIKSMSTKTMSFKVTDASVVRNPLILDGYNVIPGAKESNQPVYNLGTLTDKWNNVYAKVVYAESFSGPIVGTASQADSLYFGGAGPGATGGYVSSTDQATGNTIVARNVNGDFYANIIHATATQARYADLAEKYEADAEYEPGTVVVFGGANEITTTDIYEDTRVAGVISTNPAYLMNVESTGLPVALRGKVPCKVIGSIQKGGVLVTSSIPGCAQAGTPGAPGASIIGKSLETRIVENPDPTDPLDIALIMIVVT